MKRKSLVLMAAFSLHFLLAHHSALAAEKIDRIVAVVEGEIITDSDVRQYKNQRTFNKKIAGNADTTDPLEALIREKLVTAKIKQLGLDATEADVDQAIKEVVQRNNTTLAALKAELSRKNTPFDRYRRELKVQIQQMKFWGQVIFPRIRLTEADIQKVTGANPSEEQRLKARYELLQQKAPEETRRYVDEIRSTAFVDIKK